MVTPVIDTHTISMLLPRVTPYVTSRATPPAALDRTMRLMRDNLHAAVTDDTLLAALLRPRVLVMADAVNLLSPAAQTAYITAVLLLLRSGTSVLLDAPDVRCAGPQPPLSGDRLVSGLLDVGSDLIEDVTCQRAHHGFGCTPAYDAVIVLGDTVMPAATEYRGLVIRIGGDAVAAHAVTAVGNVAAHRFARWDPTLAVPFGALGAGGLAASEVFKLVMRSLSGWALGQETFDALFAISPETMVSLNPDGRLSRDALEHLVNLGQIDAISGGAIVQAALFALARLPGVTAQVRVIEPESADATNLNRYALLRRSMLGTDKAQALRTLSLGGVAIRPVVTRYDRATPLILGGLASAVLVGVDHIPTRWAVQRAHPTWLGVGATSHYSAMSSAHARGTPCAWCLHPTDAPDIGPIPTVAFVSHWAGVLLAWRLVLHRLGLGIAPESQYDYVTPLRLELPAAFWRSRIALRRDCPHRCSPGHRVA